MSASLPEDPGAGTPLASVPDVLRYWLAMIQHEEALGQTLRVAPRRPPRAPDLESPAPGQAYFKLLPDALLDAGEDDPRAAVAAFLRRARPRVTLPVEGERAAFLEHWLRGAYLRERNARFEGGEEREGVHVVGFPVLHLPRRSELATLLRFPVGALSWRREDGSAWGAPRYRDRRGKRLPPPPASLVVEALAEGEGEEGPLPYALDEAQLSRTLGVPEEHVGELLARLAGAPQPSPDRMIAALAALLEAPDDAFPEAGVEAALAGEGEAGDPLPRLAAAVLRRALPARVGVWPGGLVWDGSQVFATHHLQRDLRELVGRTWLPRPGSPLQAWLTGRPTPPGAGLHLGLRGDAVLTADQRRVADRALGQALVCAQGPPGTGKTELILGLAAHALVEHVAAADDGGSPRLPQRAMLVTSTNNRAVDNVVDPLTTGLPAGSLPLALRLGSRAVMRERTAPTLRGVKRWLQERPAEGAEARFRDALQRLRHLRGAAREELARVEAAVRRRVELGPARARLAATEAALAEAAAAAGAASVEAAGAARSLRADVQAWRERLEEALHALERPPGFSAAKARRRWRQAARTFEGPVAQAAATLGLVVPLPGPPGADAEGELEERWLEAFDALDDALDALDDAARALVPEASAAAAERAAGLEAARAELAARVAALEAAPDEAEDPRDGGLADLERELVRLAVEAREAWALAHRDRLTALCDLVLEALEGAWSLRRLLEDDGAARRELVELFPVMGCTLLSLGNAFPLADDALDRVVIDEAGQCHPAYAVSALARTRRALVIGDPHQLEPVIALDDAEEQRVLRRLGSPLGPEALAPFRATREAGTSAQSVAARACGEVLVLRDHFRCAAPIIAVSDTLCGYGLRVHTPPVPPGRRVPLLDEPLLLVATEGEQTALAGSWCNGAEADRVTELVGELLRAGLAPGRVAVLTPYRGQLHALRQRFRREGLPVDDPLELPEDDAQGDLFGDEESGGIALGTVHRFQGGERDVVVLSTVVTRDRSLPFTNRKVNLVNVAVSRARQHLVVVGHPGVLARGPVTGALVRAIPARAHR